MLFFALSRCGSTAQMLVERQRRLAKHQSMRMCVCVCVIMREIITPGCKHRRDENNNALPTAQLTV